MRRLYRILGMSQIICPVDFKFYSQNDKKTDHLLYLVWLCGLTPCGMASTELVAVGQQEEDKNINQITITKLL